MISIILLQTPAVFALSIHWEALHKLVYVWKGGYILLFDNTIKSINS